MAWFAVRSFYRFESVRDPGGVLYEERVVLFQAGDADVAIAKAETEADNYADGLDDCEALNCFQSFELFDEPADGVEVFSLMRDSDLEHNDYLDRFFDTGAERNRVVGDPDAAVVEG